MQLRKKALLFEDNADYEIMQRMKQARQRKHNQSVCLVEEKLFPKISREDAVKERFKGGLLGNVKVIKKASELPYPKTVMSHY